jgi:hypothetical protein
VLCKLSKGSGFAQWRRSTKAFMRAKLIVICAFCIFAVCAAPQRSRSQSTAPGHRVVIAASQLLDGKGAVLHDTRIVIEGSKIVAVDPKAGPVDYDLRGLTVLPGWIDAHVHITWSFGPEVDSTIFGSLVHLGQGYFVALNCLKNCFSMAPVLRRGRSWRNSLVILDFGDGASRSLDFFLGPHLGPFVGAECVTCLLYIPEHSRALLVSPLFPNARLIHTVEVIGSNPIAPTKSIV